MIKVQLQEIDGAFKAIKGEQQLVPALGTPITVNLLTCMWQKGQDMQMQY